MVDFPAREDTGYWGVIMKKVVIGLFLIFSTSLAMAESGDIVCLLPPVHKVQGLALVASLVLGIIGISEVVNTRDGGPGVVSGLTTAVVGIGYANFVFFEWE